jgi:DNA-binding NarL/FixJ family response regulator
MQDLSPEVQVIMEQAAFLVVDDDAHTARALSRVLAPFGVVRTAPSSTAAFDELRARTAWAGFVIDLRLPDGSGIDVLAGIRERYALTPAVILSGALENEIINNVFALGARPLSKPCHPRNLRQFAREALGADGDIPGRICRAVSELSTQHKLSPAQTEILLAAVQGVDRSSILAARQVSENTHKTQVRGILRKTRTFSLAELRDRVLRSVAGAA